MHKEWGELGLRMGSEGGKPQNQQLEVAFAFLSRPFHTPFRVVQLEAWLAENGVK